MDAEDRSRQEVSLRRAVLAGDESAWRVLYTRSFRPLHGYVFWRTGRDEERTEEIVQEVWLVAVRRIRSFTPERSSFATWLRGIAENLTRNEERRRRRLEERTASEPAEPVCTPDPGVALGRTEQIGLTLAVLPEHYRNVLEARYGEERSVPEIATKWNLSPKAAESLLSRARAAFRAAFARFGESS